MPPRRQADIPAKDARALLLPAGDANVPLFSAGRKSMGLVGWTPWLGRCGARSEMAVQKR